MKLIQAFNLTRNGAFLKGQRLDELFKVKGKRLLPEYTNKRKLPYKTEMRFRRRLTALIKMTCSNVYYKRKCLSYKQLRGNRRAE